MILLPAAIRAKGLFRAVFMPRLPKESLLLGCPEIGGWVPKLAK